STAALGRAEVLSRFSFARVSTSIVLEPPVRSGLHSAQQRQQRFPDQGATAMARPDTTPEARDRNPGPGQPATRVDPAVPLPAVLDLVQAAALLGVGRTTAYKLVHDGEWPTPVLRLGRLIKIPTQPLLDLLAGTTHEVA
ncbi:MAG TPA: excisionase family DNA-binding protein, partial [Acidothermaceae bacterium]